jgi:hypothetical protein
MPLFVMGQSNIFKGFNGNITYVIFLVFSFSCRLLQLEMNHVQIARGIEKKAIELVSELRLMSREVSFTI